MHHSYVVGKCPICGAGANGASCEPCGGFTASELLVDASCARCGGALRPMQVTVPVLPLEDYRPHLLAEWQQAELPGRVRAALAHYLRAPLPDYPVAYPTNWGIECDGELSGLRVDFPTELGLSYFYGPAQALAPGAASLAERVEAWHEVEGVWHFNGIDNSFYFAILYPAILAAAGVRRPLLRGATVNELYLLDGQKFSTSRNHALWADEFLAGEDRELRAPVPVLGPPGPVREQFHAGVLRRILRLRPAAAGRCDTGGWSPARRAGRRRAGTRGAGAPAERVRLRAGHPLPAAGAHGRGRSRFGHAGGPDRSVMITATKKR